MGTWSAAIIETRGRPGFWEISQRLHVHRLAPDLPPLALIDCEVRLSDWQISLELAEVLSRFTGGVGVGFVAQTSSDAYQVRVFAAGAPLRSLDYARDQGGWLADDGTPQSWEQALFFGGDPLDTVDDEMAEADRARVEAARDQGEPRAVMDLLRLGSLAPLRRACAAIGVDPDQPAGFWKKPTLWRRLMRR